MPKKTASFTVGVHQVGNDCPVALIAGPCVIETERLLMNIAEKLLRMTQDAGIPFIFKASYDKANRSSGTAFRGPGATRGLAMLARVKKTFGVPLITDVHCCADVAAAAEVVDILQVPAFLCRQTDLLTACAKTGRIVNVKKGQFLAPDDMVNVCGKIEAAGNRRIMLTERGASFGYHNLVMDPRSLAVMKKTGYPVVFDATHSVQLPGGLGHASGGQKEFIPVLARAAVAVGIAAVFIEVHPDPRAAKSDGPNSLALNTVPAFLREILILDQAVKGLGRK